MTPSPGIEPGLHWWKASALTTAPSMLTILTGSAQNNLAFVCGDRDSLHVRSQQLQGTLDPFDPRKMATDTNQVLGTCLCLICSSERRTGDENLLPWKLDMLER